MATRTWQTFDTALGEATAFWLDDALAGLSIGPGRDDMQRELERAWDGAFLPGQHTGTAALQAELDEYLAGTRTTFTIPLRFGGSELQHRVWDALAGIPYGRRQTYGELAARVDCKSVRAVGTAVGKNPLPLLLPCHRVVRSDGQIGNYSCADGTETKRRLLDLEAGAARLTV